MTKFLLIAAVLLATTVAELVAGAPRLAERAAEFHQQVGQQAQTDSELEMEAMKQQAASRAQQDNLIQGLQQQANRKGNNEADIATLVQTLKQSRQPLVRSRRSLNQASLFPFQTNQKQQQQQQQLAAYEEEDRLLRRSLPDLLAQARTDKNMERALLRMLINASLRTSMNGAAQLQTTNPNYYTGAADSSDNWQEIRGIGEGFVRPAFNGLPQAAAGPQMSSRLGRLLDDYAGADPVSGDSGQSLLLPDQFQSVVDKREYIKPCSFNAISCAKNPFRKL